MRPLQHSVRESLDAAVTIFQTHLAAGGPGALYLESRAIDPTFARERYRLGFVEDSTVPGFERFVGRLAIPNLCASGHVVGIKFRELPPETSDRKYDGPAGEQKRLFNTRALLTEGDVIAITEGELDAISLGSLGIPAVSVPSGASSWNKRRHWRLFEGFRRVVVFRDSDVGGDLLPKAILESDLPVIVVNPPHGYNDVNEALVAGLGDELIRLVNGVSK